MENIQFGKRPKNPLRKRVRRDLLRDWKRYLMIFAMLVREQVKLNLMMIM